MLHPTGSEGGERQQQQPCTAFPFFPLLFHPPLLLPPFIHAHHNQAWVGRWVGWECSSGQAEPPRKVLLRGRGAAPQQHQPQPSLRPVPQTPFLGAAPERSLAWPRALPLSSMLQHTPPVASSRRRSGEEQKKVAPRRGGLWRGSVSTHSSPESPSWARWARWDSFTCPGREGVSHP